MTKKGYTHIIVKKELHNQLKQLAHQEKLSMSKIIERLISINTSINTQNQITITSQKNMFENRLKMDLFSQNSFWINPFSKRVMVDRTGFEPATSAVRGRRSFR